MKVKELEVGKAYQCILSGKTMLVVKVDKPTEGNGKKPNVTEKVIAGKYVEEIQGQKVFKLDEVCDGQLIEISNTSNLTVEK